MSMPLPTLGSTNAVLDDGYDSASTDSEGTARGSERDPILRVSSTGSASSPRSEFLFPASLNIQRSVDHANLQLVSPSMIPPPSYFYPSNASTSTSDTDSDTNGSLLRSRRRGGSRDDYRGWWGRPRRRDGRLTRFMKRWTRRVIRRPYCPQQPFTILLTLILFAVFAITLTLVLMYVLNPDKEPLPWRAYCSIPSMANPTGDEHALQFPPVNLDSIPPAGLFVGVFSIDSAFERRALIRTTWASHPRSRNGAGEGDQGFGTSRTIIRFVMGQPRKDWERRVQLEMALYNDIVILPMSENMNGGKTHAFFTWAADNAWVPPLYSNTSSLPQFSYSNSTSPAPRLAPHDPGLARAEVKQSSRRAWQRPDFVAKMDDDAFLMIAELESRLRLDLHHPNYLSQARDPLIFWGYLVTNRLHRFMAGELYALSWSLVDWISKDAAVKGLTRGKEDKQTSKWMRIHPQAADIRWSSERCWIYDHPRAGTVYTHGFLFPSEVSRVKHDASSLEEYSHPSSVDPAVFLSPAWTRSSVSTFGVRYMPPLPTFDIDQSIEALIEGSEMSQLVEGGPKLPSEAWGRREGRRTRYEGKRVGGTVLVHFIKKNMWYLETAMALLDGDEETEAEMDKALSANI